MTPRGPLANAHAAPRRRLLGDSALVALGTLLLCWLFARGVWHGLDGSQFLSDIEHGALFHDRHVLYKPIAWLFTKALHWFGVPLFSAVVAASACCTAVGAGFVHRALLGLGLERRDAALAAMAAVGCFSIVYFGTLIEIHGVFFAFVGIAWWTFAKFAQAPGLVRGLLVGAAGGVAAAAHATGQLLPGVFAACAIAWIRPARRDAGRWALWLAALAAAHFATAALVTSLVMRLTGTEDPALKTGLFEGSISFVSGYLQMHTVWSNASPLLLQEWVRPYLPISLLPLLALFSPRFRIEGLLLIGCIAVYLGATTVLLSPAPTLGHPQYLPPFTLIEYGAYFMPLAVPAAVLGVRMLPRALHPALALATLAWTITSLLLTDRPVRDDAFGTTVLRLMDEQKASVLCGGFSELDSVKRLRPSLGDPLMPREVERLPVARTLVPKMQPSLFEPQFVFAYEWLVWAFTYRDQVKPETACDLFEVLYEVAHRRGELLVTDDALAILRGAKDGIFDRLVDDYLPAHFTLEPYTAGGFTFRRVTRKP